MGESHADVVVIGAGIVGLACAAQVAAAGRSTIVLERNAATGRETSSRNSGVLHAGLYYPAETLKARLCIGGREQTYERCQRLGIAHRRTGKLIVATDKVQLPELDRIARGASAAGVDNLEELDGAAITERDAAVRGVAALWSPDSGIVDAHALTQSFGHEAREHGTEIVCHTEVHALDQRRGGWQVRTRNDRGESWTVQAETVINAAGLQAHRVAELAGVDLDEAGWHVHYCKGDWFALSVDAPRPRTALVYPAPAGSGLGIHLTTDLGGRCLAGPDATYVDAVHHEVDAEKANLFAEAVAKYLPGIATKHLSPDFAGIRPKLQPAGGPFRDFVIDSHPRTPGMVHLIGIESPGLTAAAAIGEHVARLLS